MLRNLLTAAMIIGLCGLAAAPAAASPSHHGAARGRVFIHRIFYNSPGSDDRSNSSLNAEWVDLHNSSGHPITLTHWTLRDKAGHVYEFKASYRLRAHKDVRIHTGRGSNTSTNRFWGSENYIWNNDGDTAVLKSASGSVKSRCTYSDSSEQHSSVLC